MPNPCRVCTSVLRSEIDAVLHKGVDSLRSVAQRFGIPKDSVTRHKRDHLNADLVKTEHAVQVISGLPGTLSLTEEINGYKARADMLGRLAEEGKDYKTALLAIRELRQLLEAQERMRHMQSGSTADVTQLESWKRLSRHLTEWLTPVPGALAALRSALAAYRSQ